MKPFVVIAVLMCALAVYAEEAQVEVDTAVEVPSDETSVRKTRGIGGVGIVGGIGLVGGGLGGFGPGLGYGGGYGGGYGYGSRYGYQGHSGLVSISLSILIFIFLWKI